MRIKELREAAGLTQAELALACDCRSKSAVHNWETGKTSPRGKRLPRLADALGVTVPQLYANTANEAA